MAFSRLSRLAALVSLVLGALQLANAAATKSKISAAYALDPIDAQIHKELLDGGDFGELELEKAHSALLIALQDRFAIHGGKLSSSCQCFQPEGGFERMAHAAGWNLDGISTH